MGAERPKNLVLYTSGMIYDKISLVKTYVDIRGVNII